MMMRTITSILKCGDMTDSEKLARLIEQLRNLKRYDCEDVTSYGGWDSYAKMVECVPYDIEGVPYYGGGDYVSWHDIETLLQGVDGNYHANPPNKIL